MTDRVCTNCGNDDVPGMVCWECGMGPRGLKREEGGR